ncbi:MAG: hypothetical protein BRD45_05810 [Bacteroidetes bacterium QS_8_64_10]|nr:MAG: hypothetical protein BRD45_05810 [Bacteroidetes bacterium QS_8_64_10]
MHTLALRLLNLNRSLSNLLFEAALTNTPSNQSPSLRLLVIIPAFNEAPAIGRVIGDIPAGLADEVVVVNNASTDETARNAREAGATVLREERRGYGWACLRGIAYARSKPSRKQPDVIAFLDGDYSDHPEEMRDLVAPIRRDEADFVVGSGRAVYRPRPVSRHSFRRSARPRHAGQDLRLDRRDADQSCALRPALRGGARVVPAAHRCEQDHGHRQWHR